MTLHYGISDVEFEDDLSFVESDDLSDGQTKVLRRCDFCSKEMVVYQRAGDLINRLIKARRFYCTFCVRNEFYTRKGKHVMLLTMRGIISQLYHHCYLVKDQSLYLKEIMDLIDDHVKVGLLNPVFHYDPDTYLWFIDFNKVGNSGHRLPVGEVLNTVYELISCFNLYQSVREFKSHKLAAKFEEAILEFYKHRCRPVGKLICAPTLAGCMGAEIQPVNAKKVVINYRDFVARDLRLHNRK